LITQFKNFIDIGKFAFNEYGGLFVELVVLLSQLAKLTAYTYLIDEYFHSYYVLPALLPLVVFVDMKKISYLSLIALGILIACLMTIMGFVLSDMNREDKDDFKYADFFEFPLFFGVSLFLFEGDVIWINVENSMKKPTNYWKVPAVIIPIVILIGVWFSVLPYIAYVNQWDDLIIDTLHHDTIETLVQIFYIIGISLSFPIQLYPISEAAGRTDIFDPYLPFITGNRRLKFAVGAIIAMSICLGVSLIIPDLGTYANMVGGILGWLTTVVFPILFYNKAYKESISPLQWWMHIGLITFVGFLGFTAFIATIIDQATDDD
jgi:hypothetical protein